MATMKAARSPLFYRNPAGGLPFINNESTITGNIFYVDSAAANKSDTAGYGYSPDKPFATIDFAISQCTANQGDVVLVLPGHAETINAAAAIDLDIAGITVQGLGNGEDKPTITVGSTLDTATVVISAADCKLANVILQPGNDGVDILLDINADGAIVEDVELRSDETNAYQADSYIDVGGGANGADRTVIRRCKIVSITAGAAQAINISAVNDAIVIEDCWIDGDYSAAGILSGSIFTNALMRRNVISNRAAGIHAVEFTAAGTGLFVDNRMYASTLGTILDPGSLKCLGNLETDAVDQAGVDSPRTSAGGLADDSITAAAIATGAITAAKFAAGAIDAAAIANAAIDAATFAAGAIDAAAIANGAIDAATFAAGAIDAAAIANGAIDAATFAAGAIDAAAIANGAIDAATFAAGAIDAAAIATGAIDADAIANDAIDAGAIAADAITNAKIADNALAAEQFALSAGEKTTEGVIVTRATAALPQTTSVNIFTITGLVLIKRIVGYVTVQIGAVANATKLVGKSTGAGADTDLCTTLDVTGDVVDSRYEITGTFANAMVQTIDVPLAKTQTTEIVLPPGTIAVDCAGSDGGTGRVRWSVTYVPMESGAQIVAA